jgi:hypothetical protein
VAKVFEREAAINEAPREIAKKEAPMKTGRLILLLVLGVTAVVAALSAHLVAHRYQATSTNDKIFVLDTFTGRIEAYIVAGRGGEVMNLKVHRFATSD